MKKILSVLAIAFLLYACHEESSRSGDFANINDINYKESVPVTEQLKSPPPPPPAPQSSNINQDDAQQTEDIQKKIIKDGRIEIETKELQKTKSKVDVLIKKYGGYYENESYNNTDWETSFELKIRIPFKSFDEFILETEKGEDKILFKKIEARDVTDQFIDLESRLKNKRNFLKRYNDLLKQAKNIKDILEIAEKIRRLEEEIESTTGRLNYLSDLVAYSTLDLSITAEKEVKPDPIVRDEFMSSLKQSLSKGWFGFVDFLLFFIRIWPFWFILLFVYFLWRKFKNRKKKN